MTTTIARLFAGSLALLMTSAALAQDQGDQAPPPPPPSAPPPPPSSAPAESAPPEGAAPMEVPPLDIARGFSPPGQWVFTRQYGWLFMPFDRTYTYAPVAEGGDPYMYAYYPGYGWLWLAAPWIFGIGPQPYFGTYGYAQYGWYGRGYYGHPWYGYHGGYPGGYHGIVYSHVGAWHGAENHQTSSVTHQYGPTGGQRQGGGAAVAGHPAGGWGAGVHPTAAPAYHPQPTYHPQPASHAQPSYQRPHAQTPAPAAQRRPEQEQQAPAHHSTSSQGGGKRR